MSNQTFTTRRAIEVMDRIVAFLEEQGCASSPEVRAHIGLTQTQTSAYLVQLEKLGRIHCIERAVNIQGGRTPTIWGPGATPSDADDVDAPGEKGFLRRVVVRQQWAPNHVRMPMDCLLFGVPKILQGTHA